jgi:hypothetical protein
LTGWIWSKYIGLDGVAPVIDKMAENHGSALRKSQKSVEKIAGDL